MKTHQLAEGETFQTLAKQYNVPIEAILRVNPTLNPRLLKIKQIVNIPEAADMATEISAIKTKPGEIKTITQLTAAIDAAAKKYSVRPDILRALVSVESKGNPVAGSSVGAKGLTQIMDATSKALGVTDPHDIRQNLAAGASALKKAHDEAAALRSKDRFPGYGVDQDWEYALMIYHAGAPAVQSWLNAGAPTDFNNLTPEVKKTLRGFGPLTLSYPKKVLGSIKSADPFPGFRLYIKQSK